MSIKENLEQVRNEFKSDEKLLEGAFRLEKFSNATSGCCCLSWWLLSLI